MNALTVPVKLALLDALHQVHGDDAVRAVVLTGSGKAFCVGQDLREHAALLDAGDPAPLSTVRDHYNPVTLLATMPKPVVAAVNGTAAGAGLGLACACDFRVGAQGTRWTTAFTGIGLTADSGLSWTLPRLVGAARATALLLLAEPFTTEQAFEMGLLTAVVPAEQVLPAARSSRPGCRSGRPWRTPRSSSPCGSRRPRPWPRRSRRRTGSRPGPARARTTRRRCAASWPSRRRCSPAARAAPAARGAADRGRPRPSARTASGTASPRRRRAA